MVHELQQYVGILLPTCSQRVLRQAAVQEDLSKRFRILTGSLGIEPYEALFAFGKEEFKRRISFHAGSSPNTVGIKLILV
ncbi:MAG TPA: hypothetical protein VJ123_03970 [Anaerolineales bacterium]|nr:hypothetical protein [Anaerolineales bacterium]